ncbi:MAG: leucine-rich repeat domain-containing protein, partial [Clostridiales bacterium]|nr:leucine-rich repeat domain-containing protein [Clostridiales bacterium]
MQNKIFLAVILVLAAVVIISGVTVAVLLLGGVIEKTDDGGKTNGTFEDAEVFSDEKFKEYVLASFDADGDGEISDAEAKSVIAVDVDGMDIESLAGIELFTEMTALYCTDNFLTELDVSANTALEILDCSGNFLTALDISSNTNLTTLDCSSNALSELDISANTELIRLNCAYNTIDAINAFKNDKLIYLNIDGEDSVRLSEATFPDTMFRRYLRNYEGTDNNEWLTTSEILIITDVSVTGNKIESLRGIEYLTALQNLDCSDNSLGELDLSENTKLKRLLCNGCSLTSLNVKSNTTLTYLDCGNNMLTELDLSENAALLYLVCNGNSLASLNLDGCAELETLKCGDNLFDSL